jgi:hypothetical protein
LDGGIWTPSLPEDATLYVYFWVESKAECYLE